MKQEIIGFSPEKEENFLGRLPDRIRQVNLDQELKTQLAEDFGLVEFTLKYRFDEDRNIVDLKSKEKVMYVMIRGGVDEETESFRKIEEGLKNNPKEIFIHFSPKNKTEKINYPENCVDFWRVVDDEIVWNRMVVKNNFDEMNTIRQFLSGEEKVENEIEILKSPISVSKLKLAEVFNLFQLNEAKDTTNLKHIEKVVNKYLNEFSKNFGQGLTRNSDLIFRLYSACFNALKNKENSNEEILNRRDLKNYMYGIMGEMRVERSFGCTATTTVGTFGERIGYYVLSSGEIKKGVIPEGFKECKECGCWYSGEKCPFC